MAKKGKSTFNESFIGEMGKKTAGIIFALAVAAVLALWAMFGGGAASSTDQSTSPTIDKSHSKPSNSQ